MLFFSIVILLHLAYMKRPRAEGCGAVSEHSAENPWKGGGGGESSSGGGDALFEIAQFIIKCTHTHTSWIYRPLFLIGKYSPPSPVVIGQKSLPVCPEDEWTIWPVPPSRAS